MGLWILYKGYHMGLIENILRRAGYHKAAQLKPPIPGHLLATAEAEQWTIPDYGLYASQVSLYAKLSWIHTAVSMLARTAAGVTLNVLSYTKEREKDIISHPFEELLRRPNPLSSRKEFLESSFSDYILTGNCYWWLNRGTSSIYEMWAHPSKYYKPVPDGKSYLRGYNYQPEGYSAPTLLPLEEVVHFKTYNPYNSFVGLSLIESIALASAGDLAMQQQNLRTYKDEGGKLPSILSFAQMVNDSEWDKIKREVREQESRRQMMMLRGTGSGEIAWLQRSMSNKDMEYLASREFTKEEIWSVIAPGMSSMLSVNATEANSRTGKATFLEYAVWPLLCSFAEKITNDLLPIYDENLIAEFEDVRLSDVQLTLQEQAEYSRTHTVDEIRSKYYGDDPLGDERGTLLPLQVSSMVARMRADELTEDTEPIKALLTESRDEVENSGGGGVPNTENGGKVKALATWERKALNRLKAGKTMDFDFIDSRLPERVKDQLASALAECKTAAEVHEVYACKAIIQQRDPDEPRREEKERLEDKIYRALIAYWKRQAVILRPRLEAMYPQQLKADTVVSFEILDTDDELEKIVAQLIRLMMYATVDAVDLFGELISFGVDYTLTNELAASWATNYVGELIKEIDETTLKVVRSAVTDFVETPGMTISDIMARLPYTERRARMIAVTETTRAYAEGARIAGEELAKTFPDVPVYKTWYTNFDDRVCDLCGAVHGQSVPQGETFSNGLDKPPAHPNCRCWATYTTRINEVQA